jgi:hypothetical protein
MHEAWVVEFSSAVVPVCGREVVYLRLRSSHDLISLFVTAIGAVSAFALLLNH